jgi:tetratricopeptide (TPR) repeat protein
MQNIALTKNRGVVKYIPHLKKLKFTQIWGTCPAICGIVLSVLFLKLVVFATDILENPSVVSSSLGNILYIQDPASVVLNPVVCQTLPQSCFYASYMYLGDSTRYNCLVYSDRISEISYTILFSQIYDGNISIRENLIDEEQKTYSSKILGMVSLGYVLPLNIVIGGSVKTVYYDIYNTKSNIPLGVDIGAYKNVISFGNVLRNKVEIDLAISLSNIFGPVVKIGTYTEEYKLSPRVSLNISATLFPRYNFKKELLLYDKTSLYCDFYSNPVNYGVGLEYNRDKYFLRVGYNNKSFKNYSFGLGANFGSVSLNYSFVPFYDIGLHALDFTYFWGEKEEIEEKTPAELDDFLQVQKKAFRIAEKYLRDAEDLVKAKKYESALDLLSKIYPVSKDNKKITELIEIANNAILSTKISKIYADFVKASSIGDFISMYDCVLQAVDVTPESNETKQMVDEFAKVQIPNSRIFVVNDKKSVTVNKMKQNIEKYVLDHEFEKATYELKKLQLVSYQDYLEQKSFVDKEIKDYSVELVKKAMSFIKENKINLAYLCLKEAYRVSKDESIKLQLQEIQNKIKKPDLYDELYQKKLYYLACVYFATGDYQNAKNTFLQLRSLNPCFEFDLLEESLRKQKIVSLLELLP